MNIYPRIAGRKTSFSEKRVFKKFKSCRLGNEYHAYHSLLLPKHTKKYIGQIDFTVITPTGLLVIESKGGVLSENDGQWMTNDDPLDESPFMQAEDNMYSLNTAMKEAGIPFVYRRNLLGYGVILPDCTFDVRQLEFDPKTLMDERDMDRDDPVGFFIKQLEKFWSSRLNRKPEPLRVDDSRRIRTWLKPRYHGVRSLRADFRDLRENLIALKDEQMDFLETASGKERIICRGGAGTGKTLVGLDFASICEDEGDVTRFVVPGRLYMNYLGSHGYRGPLVMLHDDLKFLGNDSVDVMVIDEAQDLMNLSMFEEVDRTLKGGLEEGKWLILLDNENQAGIKGDFDQEFFSILMDMSEADIRLPKNIRNTIEIIESTRQLTGRDIGKKGTGHGEKVVYINYSKDEEFADRIANHCIDWIEAGLSPGNIVILGKGDLNDSTIAAGIASGHEKNIVQLNESNAASYPLESITYSRIIDFKGLESYAIIIDLGEFEIEELESVLTYVAITRATAILVIGYPRHMKKKIADLQMTHMNL